MGLREKGCWEETQGFDQMPHGHVLHSLTFISQNLFSTLHCSWYDLTAVALIRPACYLDTNRHGWYFTSILPQSHLTPVSPSPWIITSPARDFFFFLFSCVISLLFGSPSWINAQGQGQKCRYKCSLSPPRRKQYCHQFLNYIVPLSGITY